MSETRDPNVTLLGERNWLESLLTLRSQVGDLGLGVGQADIHYWRETGHWCLTLRSDMPASGLPQSTLGGLHPELRARITTARSALSEFKRTSDDYVRGNQDVSASSLLNPAYRLEAELQSLLEIIERNPS